jgi:glycosyltransferase involved in cell wall biosynthesis
MRIALVGDTFPPVRTSSAVQIVDLSRELVRAGHEVTVLIPAADQEQVWRIEDLDGVRVLRLRTMKIKDINYVLRTIGESLMPHMMRRGLAASPLAGVRWDGIICYVPSIFHGSLVRALKAESRCKCYLIVRDIFPEWAADLGLMGRGLPFRYFRAVAQDLYSLADTIGVQSAGNLTYFENWAQRPGRQLEILQNWLADRPLIDCSIRLSETPLAGRRVFVYAGNMGVAQEVGVLLKLASRLRDDSTVGFLFIGRGSEARRLAAEAAELGLTNVLFSDEIHPDEVPGLLAQCHVGLIALNPHHKSHNIPGKFLTYMHAGLPVLARVNPGNDLADIIREEGVGYVTEGGDIDELAGMARDMLANDASLSGASGRSRQLYRRLFSPAIAASQIVVRLRDE